MAAAFRLRRRRTAFCRAPRVACTHGTQAQSYPEVILVEGLFDYAVLWEAGFQNVTCSLGTHLNAQQFRQLCDGPRTVYLAFDADAQRQRPTGSAMPLTTSPGARDQRSPASPCPTATIPTASLSAVEMREQFQRLLERAAP